MADNGQPYAEDEDNGFVHDARHKALEDVVRRIHADGLSVLDDNTLADFLVQITDAIDEKKRIESA